MSYFGSKLDAVLCEDDWAGTGSRYEQTYQKRQGALDRQREGSRSGKFGGGDIGSSELLDTPEGLESSDDSLDYYDDDDDDGESDQLGSIEVARDRLNSVLTIDPRASGEDLWNLSSELDELVQGVRDTLEQLALSRV